MSSLELKDVDFGEHGVIYVTSDQLQQECKVLEWTVPAGKALLQLLPEQLKAFNLGKISSKRSLFQKISKKLAELGYTFTGAQCENKWKTYKRRYFTKFDRLRQGAPIRPGMRFKDEFDKEIEHCLSIERPSFRKHILAQKRRYGNLNIPPGFATKEEPTSSNDEIEYSQDQSDQEAYMISDEKLVEMVLNDDNNDNSNISKYLLSNEENSKYQQAKGDNLNQQIVKEMESLRNVVEKNLDVTSEILKTQSSTHEQILISLEAMDKREEEKLALERLKVQQMKIQNSLIAKLIQKISSGISNGK